MTQLPSSLEAERGLLGIILNHNASLFEVVQTIAAADFFEPLNGEVWTLLRDMIEANRQVTAGSLVHDAQDATVWSDVTAKDYLYRLERDAPPPHLIMGFARTIRDLSIRRRLVSVAADIQRRAVEAPVSEPADKLRLEADEAISSVFSSLSDIGLRRVTEIGDDILARLQKAGDRPIGLGLPLAALQNLTGALTPGRVYAIIGAPGSGKSALALQVMSHIAATEPALLYSIEMDAEEQVERELAAMTGVEGNRIERSLVDQSEFESLWYANEGMKPVDKEDKIGKRLYIDGSARPTMAIIRARALRMKKTIGLAALAIDHIHYVARPDPRMTEFDAIDYNLMTAKQMAKELGIPVIVLVQLGTDALRDMAKWPHRRPTQADMLFSGIVDRHTDVQLIVHRREAFLRRNEPAKDAQPMKGQPTHVEWQSAVDHEAGRAEFILTKRRGGRGFGRQEVGFDAKRVRFTEQPPDNRYDDRMDPTLFEVAS